MGRNGVAGPTSSSNLGEEYLTPKGATRFVRVYFELSWSTLNALPTTQGSSPAESEQSQSGQDGAVHPATALWQ